MRAARRVVLLFCGLAATAHAQNITKVLDNGPDGERLTFAVLGDGYAIGEQAAFAADVDRLVIKGVLAHDFYKDHQQVFNVYRVDLVSGDSGVSAPTFIKDTALRVVYNGQWQRCWLEESTETDERIVDATRPIPKVDYVLVIANEAGFGGCRRGSRLYVTRGVGWDVVAHEYGHGIAGLFDEYSVQGVHEKPPINVKNCSTVKDRAKVVWSKRILAATPVLTDDATGIDSSQTVGIFTGCSTRLSGIFRPVRACRMRENTPLFCPVCAELMTMAISPYLPAPPVEGNAAPPPTAALDPAAARFLTMTVRLKRDGPTTVLQAVEVEGPVARLFQAAPPFFVALSRDEQPIAAQFLPSDPYEIRGFPDPEQKEKGEFIAQADEATVIVSVPIAQASADQVGLQLWSIDPEALRRRPTAFFPEIATKAVLDRLGKGAKRESAVPAGELKGMIEKGRREER